MRDQAISTKISDRKTLRNLPVFHQEWNESILGKEKSNFL